MSIQLHVLANYELSLLDKYTWRINIFSKDVVLWWHIHIIRKFFPTTQLVIKSMMSQTKKNV